MSFKTYSLTISKDKTRKGKYSLLEKLYNENIIVANNYLNLKKEYKKTNPWNKDIKKQFYHDSRKMFPSVYSKMIQQTMKKIDSSTSSYKKLQKTTYINCPIVLDGQTVNLQKTNGRFMWFLRLPKLKINIPLIGFNSSKKISKAKSIKHIEITKNNSGVFYVHVVCEVESKSIKDNKNIVGIDINVSNISCSNGERYNLKPYIHKKLEYRKHKNKNDIMNWSKDYVHKLTTNIANSFEKNNVGHIVLEDLTNIRKSCSKKNGTSKGKHLNYLINNCFPFRMFQTFLSYKCIERGINVNFVNPKNTSKICNYCKSIDTTRNKQNHLFCNNCQKSFNADFNAGKNIRDFLVDEWENSENSVGTSKTLNNSQKEDSTFRCE